MKTMPRRVFWWNGDPQLSAPLETVDPDWPNMAWLNGTADDFRRIGTTLESAFHEEIFR